MNQISVFGKKLNKVDFFDFVYDTFVSAEFEEEDSLLSLQLNILYGILDAYGWTAEYRQWVADGAGVTEACASLAQTLAALSENSRKTPCFSYVDIRR